MSVTIEPNKITLICGICISTRIWPRDFIPLTGVADVRAHAEKAWGWTFVDNDLCYLCNQKRKNLEVGKK